MVRPARIRSGSTTNKINEIGEPLKHVVSPRLLAPWKAQAHMIENGSSNIAKLRSGRDEIAR